MTICEKERLLTPTDVRFVKLKRKQINHLLWDCTYIETFWKQVLEWITKNTPHARSLNITEQLVIFGVKDDVTMDKVLDLIMLMAKYYSFRCRCLKAIPNFTCFSKKVRQRALTHLGVEERPNCVFFTVVPILPAGQ